MWRDRTTGFSRSEFRRWSVILVAAAALVLVWTGVASAAPATVVHKGPSDRRYIALTFDDNYVTAQSVATLRALMKNEVPATLFLIGSPVSSTPAINNEILKGMQRGLFEVGDHSWSHPQLTKLSAAALAQQIGGGTDAFRAATGARTVPLFRPPYGATNSQVAAVAGSEGFRHLVLWDVDPRDWENRSAASIADHVISRAHNGAIVVLHLSAAHTAEAIPVIVSTLRARGYKFVTVSTMLKGDRLFLDVEAGSVVGQAVARMVRQGHMNGYDGNYFGPTDTITRAQVAKVAVLVGGLHTETVENAGRPSFSDVRPLRDSNGALIPYPFDFIEEAAGAGLVVGSLGPAGQMAFRPNEAISRVQLAQIIARMVRQLKGYGPHSPAVRAASFTDVPGYAAVDVALVAGLGLMTGYSNGTFAPWSGAQRGHVAVVMSRYLDLPVSVGSAAQAGSAAQPGE
ncbi:MAG: polysaccharide deacetylase family protein [Actinobacteria bacterium]|nr:polysaccharide deacetylase family protein [Actinomycetota bacterium]